MTDEFVAAAVSGGAHSASSGASSPDVIYLPDDRQREKRVTSGSENRQRHNLERFRTNDAEHKELHARMQASGRKSLGAYVMHLAKIDSGNPSRPRRRGRAAIDTVALTQAVAAFNRAGSNQNQIARALNELALVAHERHASRLESEIRELAEAIRAMPALFAAPVAAITAALNPVDEDA